MKRKIIIVTITAILISVSVLAYIMELKNNKLKYLSSSLSTNVTNCKLENEEDTHSGFLGDGTYFVKLNCDNDVEEEIIGKWQELPLKDELLKPLEMKWCYGDGCKNIYERYNIPNNIDGYYYFVDRGQDNKININDRSSYNFTIGLYDIDNKIIYYYELDT
jgi:hypothetical protein